MGNKFKKPTTARRAASFLAVLGALVMSSGVALMVTSTPANAAGDNVTICHQKGPDAKNGWVAQSVDKLAILSPQGHASSDEADIIPAFDAGSTWDAYAGKNLTTVFDGATGAAILANGCTIPEQQPEVLQATAVAVPVAPTCESNVASYSTAGSVGVASWDESAPPAFNTTITLTAHAADGYAFGEDATKTVDVPFGSAATGCEVVSGPQVCDVGTDHAGESIPDGKTPEEFCNNQGGPTTVVVSPPKAHTPKAHTPKAATVTTPTVVHAGLASVSTQDLRGEQGLALMVAGMVMLGAAGGLGLRLRRVASRI